MITSTTREETLLRGKMIKGHLAGTCGKAQLRAPGTSTESCSFLVVWGRGWEGLGRRGWGRGLDGGSPGSLREAARGRGTLKYLTGVLCVLSRSAVSNFL